jgi:hypothetical protein
LTGRATDRAQDGERGAGSDTTGAGDDDDGDRGADVACDEEGERGGSEREVDQVAGEAVRCPLYRRARPLGPLNSLHDLAEAGIATQALRPDLERAGLIDRSRVDGGPGALLDRHRLAGNRGLVDVGVAGYDDPVDGDVAARIHQDEIPGVQRVGGNVADLAIAANGRRLGQVGEQLPDRLPAPGHRQAFQDLRAKHEPGDDQGGEELTNEESGDERDRHRQLHRHLALEDVLRRFLEDWVAAHQRGSQSDDADAGKRLPESEPYYCGG